ncbi:MAG: protein TolR [Alphaproteobacteria bacterium]|nr:MAG: protein TolR [Alphaproteobacteria bacterium]
MGAKLGNNRGRKRHQAMAEINVTPFVDVMLVLLIVFMVTAPLLTAGIPVDLPESKAQSLIEDNSAPVEVTLTVDGIFIGESAVSEKRLIPLLNAMTKGKDDRRIYLRADKSLDYGRVMKILGAINSGGFQKVALISIGQ